MLATVQSTEAPFHGVLVVAHPARDGGAERGEAALHRASDARGEHDDRVVHWDGEIVSSQSIFIRSHPAGQEGEEVFIHVQG